MQIKLFTIPNIITLCNLLCGSLAVVITASSVGDDSVNAYTAPLILIIAAAVFDFLDGFSARLLKQYSKLGVQLDSLSDMVSFGLAPAVILLTLYHRSGGIGMWYLITLSVALFSALRLAKFNIDDSQSESFEGLPTPACALLVASAAYYFTTTATPLSPTVILCASVILAWLLIAPIRMFSLKFHGFGLSDSRNIVRYGFLLASLGILIFTGLGGLWYIIILYILTSIILNIAHRI